MSDIKYRMLKVAELPDHRIYAQRTPGGGIAYFTEKNGEMEMVVNMTHADSTVVKLILDLDRMLNKKDKTSTGTRFDTLELNAVLNEEKTKTPRVDRMNRCIKCGVVLTKENTDSCDIFSCPQV